MFLDKLSFINYKLSCIFVLLYAMAIISSERSRRRAVSQLLFSLNCRKTRNMNTLRSLENPLFTRRFAPALLLHSNSPKTFFLTGISSHGYCGAPQRSIPSTLYSVTMLLLEARHQSYRYQDETLGECKLPNGRSARTASHRGALPPRRLEDARW